jgi:hypothetical protein
MDIANYLTDIDGIFYRAIDPAYRNFALSGSRERAVIQTVINPHCT